uniref:hypothetical protein n=1 Tax=Paracoccus sp. TRP TaxID=412597 RepID=UPI001ED8CB2D
SRLDGNQQAPGSGKHLPRFVKVHRLRHGEAIVNSQQKRHFQQFPSALMPISLSPAAVTSSAWINRYTMSWGSTNP